jgi:hypothetical protein
MTQPMPESFSRPADPPSRQAQVAFFALWAFVIFVSVLDGYLVLTNREYIAEFEMNPVGQALLKWNGGDVWLLLGVKAAGTVLACTIVLMLYWSRPRLGLWIAGTLAILQGLLLAFLLLA